MSLQSRLDALERKAREGGYVCDVEPCPSCGWSRPCAPSFVMIHVESDGAPTCTACGNYVDEAGDAVGGDRTTIVLEGLRLEPRG